MINYLFSNPLLFFVYLISLLISLSIHEFSHAWVADYLGDPTARLQGRLTLNPKAHIDIFGMIFLLLFGFGWGKPVPVDAFNLKNPRKDTLWISLAGPTSNFILAILLSIVLRLFILFKLQFIFTISLVVIVFLIRMNIVLGIFNLLPISPLDGFKVVEGLLPEEKAREWAGLERLGFIFLLALIFPIGNSSLLDNILGPVSNFITNLLFPLSLTGGII